MKTLAIYRNHKGRKNKKYSLYDLDSKETLLENKNIKVVLDAVKGAGEVHTYYVEENAHDKFNVWDWGTKE